MVQMSLTDRELWTLIHGMIFGSFFLLGFAGGLEGLYSLRPRLLSDEGVRDRVRRLRIGVVTMAVAAWGTVITGTWIVYPWYREEVADSPRSLLLADPNLEEWHHFGMEWKEHVAWISPILAAGVGALTLGILTTLAEASTGIKDFLSLYDPVGPLGGKTIGAVLVWLVAWGVLHMRYRDKEVESRGALTASLIMIGLGVLGTFPIFFQLFTPPE